MFRRSASGRRGCCAVASAYLLCCGGSAYASLLGASVTTQSQVNMDPVESRGDTVVDPGVEIQFGDANDFSWMVAGDAIDFGPRANPAAPWQVGIDFGATHDFEVDDVLTLKFSLPSSLEFGVAAITEAITVNLITGTLDGNMLTLEIEDMWQVSQGDFGGRIEVAFSVVSVPPCPGDLDGDDDTDVFDFAILAGNFGQSVTPGTGGDYNESGTVDVFDFATLAGDFGCVPP